MGPPPETSPPAPVSVLLVAANSSDLDSTAEFLRSSNGGPSDFRSRIAASLDEALECLEKNDDQIDAIVLDLSSGRDEDFEFLEAFRSRAPRTPVVVMAPDAEKDLDRELLKRGAQDFLPKSSLTADTLKRSIIYSIERKARQAPATDLDTELKDTKDKLGAMQQHLIDAKKLESLGRMASGVAHEVKNPLGMLQMGVDFFRQRHDPEDPVSELILRRMEEAIDRADGIVRGMADFSKSGDLDLKQDDLNEVLEAALSLTHHDLTRGKINIESELAENMPSVMIDRAKVEQVFVSIITNALHAMPEGGDLDIKTYWDEIDAIARNEGLRSLEHLRAGDRVAIVEFRDHGSGIPQEQLDKIFDPFFTTKPTGMGTGLGLAVAKAIVDVHRGTLRITNMDPPGVLVQVIFRAARNGITAGNSLPSAEQTA